MSWDRQRATARDRAQGRLLDDWLTHEVRPFSAFWHNRLGGRRVRSLAELATVPVATEAQLAGAGGAGNPALLLLPTEAGFKRHAARGDLLAAAREVGGGGEDARRAALFRRYKPVHVHEAGVARLLAIAYSRSDLDRLHLAGARLVEVLGLGADDTLVNAVPAGPSLRFWGLYHAALAARMAALHPRGAGEAPLRPAVRAIAMLPPTVLAVPVAEAATLLDGLAERRVPLRGLRTVLTVGAPPSPRLRAALCEAATRLSGQPVRVQAVWAPESARALWGECRPASADPGEATYGLHTYPDLEIVEVRDIAGGGRAGEGRDGEIVVTSLGWRGTALVRAATGAWTAGLAATVPCPACGRTVPRLAPAAVEGAWQPRIATGDGRTVRVDLRDAPAALTPEALAAAGATRWSLRPVSGRLVLTVDAAADRAALVELARRVGIALGVDLEVRVDAAAAVAAPQLGDAGVAA